MTSEPVGIVIGHLDLFCLPRALPASDSVDTQNGMPLSNHQIILAALPTLPVSNSSTNPAPTHSPSIHSNRNP